MGSPAATDNAEETQLPDILQRRWISDDGATHDQDRPASSATSLCTHFAVPASSDSPLCCFDSVPAGCAAARIRVGINSTGGPADAINSCVSHGDRYSAPVDALPSSL